MSFYLHPRDFAFFGHPANSFLYPGAHYTYRRPSVTRYPLSAFLSDEAFFPRLRSSRYENEDEDEDDDLMDFEGCANAACGDCATGACGDGSCNVKSELRKGDEDLAAEESTDKIDNHAREEVKGKEPENRLASFTGFGHLLRGEDLAGNGIKFKVNETEEALTISTDKLEGFDKSDLKVDFDHGSLIVSAEKKVEKKDERTGAVSRTYKSFRRAFRLPKNINKEGIRAKFNDGESVLAIEVPKTKPIETKKDTIVIN